MVGATGIGVIVHGSPHSNGRGPELVWVSEAYADLDGRLGPGLALQRALELARALGARTVTVVGDFAKAARGIVDRRIAERWEYDSLPGRAALELATTFEKVTLRQGVKRVVRVPRGLARRAAHSGRSRPTDPQVGPTRRPKRQPTPQQGRSASSDPFDDDDDDFWRYETQRNDSIGESTIDEEIPF